MNVIRRACLLLLVLSPAILIAQAAPQAEAGKFRLHKFEQAIGEENYTITPDGNALTLKTDFKFTDRGSPVPLTATLRTSDSYVPERFTIKGNTSRMSDVDTAVTINGAWFFQAVNRLPSAWPVPAELCRLTIAALRVACAKPSAMATTADSCSPST